MVHGFSYDIIPVSDSNSTGIVVNGDKNTHLGCKSFINTQGNLICEYGHDELGEVENISILDTVIGVACICMTFGPDNLLWVAEWEAHHFVRTPTYLLV